jgi:hypothetical protein
MPSLVQKGSFAKAWNLMTFLTDYHGRNPGKATLIPKFTVV